MAPRPARRLSVFFVFTAVLPSGGAGGRFLERHNLSALVATLACAVDADSMERRHLLALTGLTLTLVGHRWFFDQVFDVKRRGLLGASRA
jgi:hypothetical protein